MRATYRCRPEAEGRRRPIAGGRLPTHGPTRSVVVRARGGRWRSRRGRSARIEGSTGRKDHTACQTVSDCSTTSTSAGADALRFDSSARIHVVDLEGLAKVLHVVELARLAAALHSLCSPRTRREACRHARRFCSTKGEGRGAVAHGRPLHAKGAVAGVVRRRHGCRLTCRPQRCALRPLL